MHQVKGVVSIEIISLVTIHLMQCECSMKSKRTTVVVVLPILISYGFCTILRRGRINLTPAQEDDLASTKEVCV